MASTTEIKNGLCMDYNHDIYTVVEFQHVKPGKGAAFVRTKLKSLTTGRVIDNTFPSGHKIDVVRVERRKFQFLYKDESGYNFMDNDTFEQVSLDEKLLDAPQFLKEGADIEILYHADKEIPLTTEMPSHITLEVTWSEMGVKGDTATNVTKNCTVETGANVKVPIFINEGDRIKIDTRTGEYLERINNKS
jgi:elongation factor P